MTLPIHEALDGLYDSRRLASHLAARSVYKDAQQRRLGDGPPSPERRGVQVDVLDSLPQLAWVCVVADGSYHFKVGPGVDHGDGFVLEGVWDGEPGERNFHASEYVFGSGARIGKWVIFVPPRYCWEGLFIVHDKVNGRVVVANSIALALAESNVPLDGQFFSELLRDLRVKNDEATAVGLDRYDPAVVDHDDFSLRRMLFDNFVVDDAGRVRIVSQEPEVRFSDFDSYVAHLLEVLERIVRNGAQAGRRLPMTPVTPISSGYDSPAVGVLAARLGQRRAVTLDVTVKGRHDSGAEVGRLLGLDVERIQHVRGDDVPVLAWEVEPDRQGELTEFVATAGLGDDVMLATLEPSLRGQILLSGAAGDSIWKRASTMPPGLPVRVVYGKSFTEFRLRVGFAFVPVPAIGARYSHAVRRITRSDEMAPWTLNTPYDRPIARRLIEQAGVPRGMFAQHKAATNPTILNYEALLRPSFETMIGSYRAALEAPTAGRSGTSGHGGRPTWRDWFRGRGGSSAVERSDAG